VTFSRRRGRTTSIQTDREGSAAVCVMTDAETVLRLRYWRSGQLQRISTYFFAAGAVVVELLEGPGAGAGFSVSRALVLPFSSSASISLSA